MHGSYRLYKIHMAMRLIYVIGLPVPTVPVEQRLSNAAAED